MDTVSFLNTQWSVHQMFYYFVIYATIGWFIEVIYMTLETGRFENRGFLNGPLCPIYGFGMVFILMALTPIKDNAILLYVGSVILCTSWEFLIGYFLEKVFHNTWWDYSHERFNLKGYICLKISLLWGVGCLIIMRIVHPAIAKLVELIPVKVGVPVGFVMLGLIFFDLGVSLAVVIKLNNRLKKLDDIQKKLRVASDAIGENLSDEVLELKTKYEKLAEYRDEMQERLIRAFPKMHSHRYNVSLSKIRDKLRLREKLSKIKLKKS